MRELCSGRHALDCCQCFVELRALCELRAPSLGNVVRAKHGRSRPLLVMCVYVSYTFASICAGVVMDHTSSSNVNGMQMVCLLCFKVIRIDQSLLAADFRYVSAPPSKCGLRFAFARTTHAKQHSMLGINRLAALSMQLQAESLPAADNKRGSLDDSSFTVCDKCEAANEPNFYSKIRSLSGGNADLTVHARVSVSRVWPPVAARAYVVHLCWQTPPHAEQCQPASAVGDRRRNTAKFRCGSAICDTAAHA